MEWTALNWLNVLFVFFSFWVAETRCEHWGPAWWLNIFASALNGVIVGMRIL